MMAAMGSANTSIALKVAFTHLFFNLWGIIIWFIIPKMRRIPIQMAKWMGNITARYRWFAVFYILSAFLIVPGILLALGSAGWKVMFGILFPFCIFAIALAIIFYLRKKKPEILPKYFAKFYWLPSWCSMKNSLLARCHEKQLSKAQKREQAESERQNQSERTNIIDLCYMMLGDVKMSNQTISV